MRRLVIIVFIFVNSIIMLAQQELEFKGEYGKYSYSFIINDDDTVTITKYTGSESLITIPAKINEKIVTKITSKIFSDTEQSEYKIKGISIPATVISVEKDSFAGIDLKIVIIYGGDPVFDLAVFDDFSYTLEVIKNKQNSVRSSGMFSVEDVKGGVIHHRAFIVKDNTLIKYRGNVLYYQGLFDDNGNYFAEEIRLKDKEIIVPEEIYGQKIYAVSAEAFNTNQIIESIDDKEIMNLVRKNKYPTEKIVLPYGIISLGDHSFISNRNLKEVVIPTSITEIGKGIFFSAEALTLVTDETGKQWGNDQYIAIRHKIYKYIGSDKDVVIPKEINGYTITKIDERAFYHNDIVNSIVMPDTIEVIGENAFSNMPFLNSITISNNLRVIPKGFLSNNGNLKEIVIPDSVTFIDSLAFYNCSDLDKITLNSTITFLGSNIISKNAKAVICTQKGSAADEHAKKYDLKVEYID